MSTQDSRIKIKRSTVSATVPTVAPSTDHTQPSPAWSATDIYKGELFINQADNAVWSRGDDGVFCIGGSASLTLTSAQVLALNTTPLTIVPAVSGYAIEAVSVVVSIDYNSSAYATNTNLMIITDTADNPQYKNDALLQQTVDSVYKFPEVSAGTGTQLIANKALTVTVITGNPTAGDSPIKVFVNYRLIPV
jgi:hypothetical protein